VRGVKLATHLHLGQSVWNVWWTERLQSLTSQIIKHLQPSVKRQYLLCYSGRPICQEGVDKRTIKLPGQPVCRLRMIPETSRHVQYISYFSLLHCVCIPTAHTHTHTHLTINFLKTKLAFYVRTECVPRSKHSLPWL